MTAREALRAGLMNALRPVLTPLGMAVAAQKFRAKIPAYEQ